MKRKILFLIVLLLAGWVASAQTEKGKWQLGGLNLISFQTGTEKYSSGTYDMKTNFTNFTIGPSILNASFGEGSLPTISYGLTDNLFGGISLMLASASSKDEEDNDKSSSTIFLIGPSVRYFLMSEKEFSPFVEGKAGFGSYSYKYGDSGSDESNLSGWYIGTGATYFFSENAGIDFTLGYQHFTNKEDDSDSDSKGTQTGVSFGIGVIVAF